MSRIIAGDRWLVRLEAGMDIPLSSEYLDSLPEWKKAFAVMEKALGPGVSYRYAQEKHFVDQRSRDAVFDGFLKTFKENILSYLKHPDFARRFILSRYRELKRKDPRLFAGG